MEENFNPRTESALKESNYEGQIRPKEFAEFAGQDKNLENLKIFVKAALLRGEALDHVLFHGPPGLGKTTLANIVANELGVNMKVTSGPVLDKPGDLAGLLMRFTAFHPSWRSIFIPRWRITGLILWWTRVRVRTVSRLTSTPLP